MRTLQHHQLRELATRRPSVTHNWTGGLLWVLCAALALGMLDKWNEAARQEERAIAAEADARRLAVRLAEDRALRGIPNPAIVIDAHNAERFGFRLSEIAGGLDGARAELHGRKP